MNDYAREADHISSLAEELADHLRRAAPVGRGREAELASQIHRLATAMAMNASGYQRAMLEALAVAAGNECDTARCPSADADEVKVAQTKANRAWDDVRRTL